ncbi:hypothetical protein K457DRAFT_124917 [Linnemannia elongata AG-77]|uniref:LYC1 C-terminal domain-containing protein n=1 Tax=Linnemannia elongata AG-77 TaxID=1314771 RepID=A0A197K026_9FUNG|nr:hypothetical protein K457DRAFT_124917 [Linnemannia elongata AG-77]
MSEITNSTPTKTPASKPVRGTAPYALSDLILLPTTVPEIIQKTWTNNMEEWAKGVPEDKYHARERHLAATAFSSEGRLITWVLVPKPGTDVTESYREAVGEGGVRGSFVENDGSKDNLERILGALETYERPGLVARTEDDGEEGVKDVSTMSVASVYVPSKYRHHGYGHLMMKLLWEEMESRKIAFTFLYSDLGPDFYGDFGWTARTCTQILIPTTMTLPTPPTARTRGSVKSITLEPVATDIQLQDLIEQDALLVRKDLEARLATAKTNNDKKAKTIVAVTPEIRSIQWLHARSFFNASVIFSQNHSPLLIQTDLKYGVRVPGSKTQFVLWHHDFTDDNLFILRWRLDPSSSSPEEDTDAIALAFAQAAKDEAKKWGLSKVVFWNGDEALAHLLGLKVETRKDSIPSLGLLNSVYPGHQPEELEWVLNQKYSWC